MAGFIYKNILNTSISVNLKVNWENVYQYYNSFGFTNYDDNVSYKLIILSEDSQR